MSLLRARSTSACTEQSVHRSTTVGWLRNRFTPAPISVPPRNATAAMGNRCVLVVATASARDMPRACLLSSVQVGLDACVPGVSYT